MFSWLIDHPCLDMYQPLLIEFLATLYPKDRVEKKASDPIYPVNVFPRKKDRYEAEGIYTGKLLNINTKYMA